MKAFPDDIKAHGQKIVPGGNGDESPLGYFIPVTVGDSPPENAKIVGGSSSARKYRSSPTVM